MEDFLVNVQWPIKKSPYFSSTKTLRLLCEGRYTSDYVEVLQQCSTWMEFSIRELLQNERQEHYPLIVNDVSYYVLCEVLCLIDTGNVDIYAQKYLKHFATALKKLGIHQPEVPNEDTFVVLRASIFAVPNTYVDDLVIYCEGQKLSANRCVLMVRSGFFDAVLQNVPENGEVHVHGVRFQQMEQVVSFLYCRDIVLRTWTKHGKSEFEQFCGLIERFKIRNLELPQIFHEPLGLRTTAEGGSSDEQAGPTRSRRERRLRQWFAVVADRINRLTVRRRGDIPRTLIDPSSGETSRMSQTPSQDTSSSGTRTRGSSERSKITAKSSLESSNITYDPKESVVSPDVTSLDIISSIEKAEGDASKRSAEGLVSKVLKSRVKKYTDALPKIRIATLKRRKKSHQDRKRSSNSSLTQELPSKFLEPLGLSTTPEGGSSEEKTSPTRSGDKRRLRKWFAIVADRINRLTVRRRGDRPRSLIDPSSGDTSRVSRSFQSQETDLQTPKKSSKKGSSFRKLRKSFRKKGKVPSEKDELFELADFSRTKSGQSSEGGFSSDVSSSGPEQAGPSRKSAVPSPKKTGRSPKEPGDSPKGPGRSPKRPGRSPKGIARSPKGVGYSAEEAGPSGTQAGFFRRVLQSFFKKSTPPTSPKDDETVETVFA